MKYGVFSVSMPEYTPEESVKLLKELGYDGVEWRVTNFPKEKPQDVPFDRRYWAWNESTIVLDTIEEKIEEVKALCDQYGLEIFSLTTYLKPAQVDEIEKVMRAAAKIGVPKIRVFQDNYAVSDEQIDYREACYTCQAQVRVLEKLAQKYGVKVMLELHMNTLLCSPSSAYNLLSGFDPKYVGVIFDPGNMVTEGFEVYQKSFELLGPYIAHIHMKNSKLVENGTDDLGSTKWVSKQTPIWEGMADLRELFRVMKKYGYDGTVSIEDFSNEMTTAEKLKANIAYLHKLASSVGME